jgi:hypothetical protein
MLDEWPNMLDCLPFRHRLMLAGEARSRIFSHAQPFYE